MKLSFYQDHTRTYYKFPEREILHYLILAETLISPRSGSEGSKHCTKMLATEVVQKLRQIVISTPRQETGSKLGDVVAAVVARNKQKDEEDDVEETSLPHIQHVKPRRYIVDETPLLQFLHHTRSPAATKLLLLLLVIVEGCHRSVRRSHLHHLVSRVAAPAVSTPPLPAAAAAAAVIIS